MSKNCWISENSVKPDQMQSSLAFDLGLLSLFRPVSLNTQSEYGNHKSNQALPDVDSKVITVKKLTLQLRNGFSQ